MSRTHSAAVQFRRALSKVGPRDLLRGPAGSLGRVRGNRGGAAEASTESSRRSRFYQGVMPACGSISEML